MLIRLDNDDHHSYGKMWLIDKYFVAQTMQNKTKQTLSFFSPQKNKERKANGK